MLYTLFSIIAKIFCVLMALSAVMLFVGVFYILMKGSGESGSNPHNPANKSGMPWG